MACPMLSMRSPPSHRIQPRLNPGGAMQWCKIQHPGSRIQDPKSASRLLQLPAVICLFMILPRIAGVVAFSNQIWANNQLVKWILHIITMMSCQWNVCLDFQTKHTTEQGTQNLPTRSQPLKVCDTWSGHSTMQVQAALYHKQYHSHIKRWLWSGYLGQKVVCDNDSGVFYNSPLVHLNLKISPEKN
jgi:hypothetical protein